MALDPDLPEARDLHAWKVGGGGAAPMASLSAGGGGTGGPGSVARLEDRVAVAYIKDEGLGAGEKPDYVSLKGLVNYIKHDSEPW